MLPGEHPAAIRLRDEDLLAAVARHDCHAFAMLYDRYAPTVFGLALTMLGERAAAEAALHEAFWRVWQQAGSYDHGCPPAPWLVSLAHQACHDQLRRRRHPQVDAADLAAALQGSGPDPSDVGAPGWHVEQRQGVVAALHQLPMEQRQTLTLAYFGGLTEHELAACLGAPPSAIKARVRLGLHHLRTLLDGGA